MYCEVQITKHCVIKFMLIYAIWIEYKLHFKIQCQRGFEPVSKEKTANELLKCE